MRKVALLFAIGLLATSAAAVTIGPVRPRHRAWALDMYGSAEERDMQLQSNPANKSQADLTYGLGRVSYGVTDKLELRFGLGAAGLDVTDLTDALTPTQTKFTGSTAMVWTAGFGTVFHETKRFDWTFQLDYVSHSEHDGSWPGVSLSRNDLDYKEWHAAVAAQYRSERFRPYLGVAYSNARVEYDLIAALGGNGRDESKHNIGPYVGVDATINPRWSGFVEGRFIDVMSVGGGLRMLFGK